MTTKAKPHNHSTGGRGGGGTQLRAQASRFHSGGHTFAGGGEGPRRATMYRTESLQWQFAAGYTMELCVAAELSSRIPTQHTMVNDIDYDTSCRGRTRTRRT